MRTYYNEIDPAAAAVLRELVASRVIAPGDVDERSIKDVTPDDVRGYTQCHFFAGGGLWSVAARLAGWPDERELWTGSCPCQPFSSAGKGLGTDDPRHLWPDFHRLIRAIRPPVVMGEQVAGKAGYAWFDGVRADMEGGAYSLRAVDIPASSVDAPHQRNRLYWLAVVNAAGERWREGRPEHELRSRRNALASANVQLQPDANGSSAWGHSRSISGSEESGTRSRDEHRDFGDRSGDAHGGVLTDAIGERQQVPLAGELTAIKGIERAPDIRRNGSWWADAEWIVSPLDGKARRTKPGLPFLVDGLLGRVDLWRIGGNAVVPILAAEVIAAFLETEASLI